MQTITLSILLQHDETNALLGPLTRIAHTDYSDAYAFIGANNGF